MHAVAASSTTSNAARRRISAQPCGLRRQAAIFYVTPPRRIAIAYTSSSSFLESGRLALATRPCAHEVRHSYSAPSCDTS